MNLKEFWVCEGNIVPRPYDEFGKPCSERSLLQQKNHVKIEVSSSRVTIKWYMAVANWASLYFVKDWISAYHGPFDLMLDRKSVV